MGRRSRIHGLPLCGVALIGGCASSAVSLGDNVDAGVSTQAEPRDAASTPDAWVSSLPGVDAAGTAAGLCPGNPTFAGDAAVGITQGPPSPNLPEWQVCGGRVDVNPGFCNLSSPQATTTYLGLPVGYAGFQSAISPSISNSLGTTMPPGDYPLTIELGIAVSTVPRGGFGVAGGAPVDLVFYGSSTPCGRDEPPLATTSTIVNVDSWITYPVTLTATQPFSNLVLVPVLTSQSGSPAAGAYVIAANFISLSCQ